MKELRKQKEMEVKIDTLRGRNSDKETEIERNSKETKGSQTKKGYRHSRSQPEWLGQARASIEHRKGARG